MDNVTCKVGAGNSVAQLRNDTYNDKNTLQY
jgi:hypothetical protein